MSERRRLEVARALALEPELILLDEVMAGLNATEVGQVIDLIHRLNARGMTFLVIEHNLKVVRAFSQRVIVLDHGAKIAEGNAARRAERSRRWSRLSRQEAWRGAMSALLDVQGVGSGYGDVPVLSDVSLTVGADEIVSVVGANGAGKTTLLSTISGLLPCTAGRDPFRRRARSSGYPRTTS